MQSDIDHGIDGKNSTNESLDDYLIVEGEIKYTTRLHSLLHAVILENISMQQAMTALKTDTEFPWNIQNQDSGVLKGVTPLSLLLCALYRGKADAEHVIELLYNEEDLQWELADLTQETSRGITPLYLLLACVLRDKISGKNAFILLNKAHRLYWNIPSTDPGCNSGLTPLSLLIVAVIKNKIDPEDAFNLLQKSSNLEWNIPITGEGPDKGKTPLFFLLCLAIQDVHGSRALLNKVISQYSEGVLFNQNNVLVSIQMFTYYLEMNDVINAKKWFSKIPSSNPDHSGMTSYLTHLMLTSLEKPKIYEKSDSPDIRKEKKKHNLERKEILWEAFKLTLNTVQTDDILLARKNITTHYVFGKKAYLDTEYFNQTCDSNSHAWLHTIYGPPDSLKLMFNSVREKRKLEKKVKQYEAELNEVEEMLLNTLKI